jgi:protein-S-isoprenylcysteine O-methyltransferase Ste14
VYALHVAVAALWAGWAAYWVFSSSVAKPNRRQEEGTTRLVYGVPLWVAVWLLVGRGLPWPFLHGRFVPDGWPVELGGVLLVAMGIGFAIWARSYLGSNWSSMVTVKQDHDLIRGGPYAWVRHPIYSGLLLAIAGTALAFGEWRDLVALALVFASCWYKLRLEERWMLETFGSAYEDYRKRVFALIPKVL